MLLLYKARVPANGIVKKIFKFFEKKRKKILKIIKDFSFFLYNGRIN